MASTAALAKRRGLAYERLNRAAETLSAQYSSVFPPILSRAKDPDFRHVEEVEQMADLLEAVAGIKVGDAKSANRPKSKKDNSND